MRRQYKQRSTITKRKGRKKKEKKRENERKEKKREREREKDSQPRRLQCGIQQVDVTDLSPRHLPPPGPCYACQAGREGVRGGGRSRAGDGRQDKQRDIYK